MIKKVQVTNLHKSLDSTYLYSEKFTNILSVIDPQRAPLLEIYHKQLNNITTDRFYFYDVTDTNCIKAPTYDCISEIVNRLLNIHSESNDNICLIHCYAGRQRSTALAYIALAIKNNFNYEQSLDELYTIRPKAFPNSLILELADQILNSKFEENFYNYVYNKSIIRQYDNHYINFIKENFT